MVLDGNDDKPALVKFVEDALYGGISHSWKRMDNSGNLTFKFVEVNEDL